jgi:hypothetical protein
MGCQSSKESAERRAIPRDSIYVAKKKAKQHKEKTGESLKYVPRKEFDPLIESDDKEEKGPP